MERNAKNREKKHAWAKRHIQRQAKSARTKRARSKARKLRKDEKELKSAARAARRKERRERQGEGGEEVKVTPIEPEKLKKRKPKKDHNPVDKGMKKLRKVLMSAPLKKTKSNEKEKAAKDIGSKDGWKAGSRNFESERAPTRKEKVKKLSEGTMVKLLKKAMNLARKERSGTDMKVETLADVVPPVSGLGVDEGLEQKERSKTGEDGGAGALGEAFNETSVEDGGRGTFKEAQSNDEKNFFKKDRGGGAFEETLQLDLKKNEEDQVHLKPSTMKGGAWQPQSNENEIRLAIKKSGEGLVLDRRTRGDGNCCSRALVQQCKRPPVKLFLQSRGITIVGFMQLKEEVAQFIVDNRNTEKVLNLRRNFEYSQMTIQAEGLERRSWRQYWSDMKQDAGEVVGPQWLLYWADDIWLQAAAYYLNMNIHIIWAGAATDGRIVSDVDGDWSPVDEEKPTLYLGYIVDAHYQSLLPQAEHHPTPAYLQREAIDNALAAAMQGLDAELKQQSSQVSFNGKNVEHKLFGPWHHLQCKFYIHSMLLSVILKN